jgi:FdrA protein
MACVNRIEPGRYLDSVALMRASRRLAALGGVEAAALMIGTPANKALLRDSGLLEAAGEQAGANDLIIAARGPGAQAAVAAALELLAEGGAAPVGTLPRARSLAGALARLAHANLALVSVPGEFAAREARAALARGLNVLVFSSHVPLEEEFALKLEAATRGLLLMGPDCGTAFIGGTPLAFCNALPRGDIGVVSASGTGLQEVATLIARLGGGISHAIGVGGRDLDARIGGLGTLAALDALERDARTRSLVLVSKPPAPEVAARVLERVRRATKPAVVCLLGLKEPGIAPTLRDAAERATGARLPAPQAAPRRVRGKVVGLYCGGTLCAEAESIFRDRGLAGHDLVDLGDDAYTLGRPHPMIEPGLRNEHMARALADPGVGALLVDVVLGYGAHPDPAGVLLQNDLRAKPVVASVTGTDADPQVRAHQAAKLRAAGVLVAESNAHAAELAAALVG